MGLVLNRLWLGSAPLSWQTPCVTTHVPAAVLHLTCWDKANSLWQH